jgi:hypothetical protein
MLALPFLVEDVMKLKGSYYGYLMSVLTLSSIVAYFVFGCLKTSSRQNYTVICALFFIEAAVFLFISIARNTVIVFRALLGPFRLHGHLAAHQHLAQAEGGT